MPKSKEFVSSDDESSGSQSEEDKKSKKRKPKPEKEEKPAKKAKTTNESETPEWDLGNNRRVTVREFKGKYYVDIREMYLDKSGEFKPGKKGISMNLAQWRKFMEYVQEIDEVAKSKS